MPGGGQDRAAALTIHDLRRTGYDLARQHGADGLVARSLIGHVTEGMRARYSSVRDSERRQAVVRIAAAVTGAGALASESGTRAEPGPKTTAARLTLPRQPGLIAGEIYSGIGIRSSRGLARTREDSRVGAGLGAHN